MGFTERFKKLMDNSNVTQTELAKIVDLTPQAISRWYKGQTEPDTETLKKIANYFDVSIDFLIGNEKEATRIETELKEIDALKKILIKNGYMKYNEDLTNEELDRLIKFVVTNKEFLKEQKK